MVIQTTGIADPGPILHMLVVDTIIAPHYRMDGVVTLADTATDTRILDTQFEVVNQVTMADLIGLSKADLVTPPELARFEARLVGINSTAQRVRVYRGRVPDDTLFGLSAMRPDVANDEVTNWLGMAMPKPDPLAGLSGFSEPDCNPATLPLPGAGGIGHHGDRITSASIEVGDSISVSVFDFWIDTLIALKSPNILRMKGIVHVEDMDWPFVFHGVQYIFDAPVLLKSWAGKDKTSRVVVIARDMAQSDLEGSLNTLRMRPKELEETVDGMMVQTVDMPF